MSPGETEQRIVDLELRFMRAEKMIEELNDVLVEQSREIDRLNLEVKSLREHAAANEESVKNERPPHY